MLSEYLLGHLLSLSWGTVYHQYALTLGIFVCAMGWGAWKFRFSRNPYRLLMQFQIFSALLLILSTSITWAALEIFKHPFLSLLQLILIAIVGFISGSELPLLEKLQGTTLKAPQVLFYDYLGMAMASLFFGFYFLQAFGVLGTLVVSLSLHLMTLATFYWRCQKERNQA